MPARTPLSRLKAVLRSSATPAEKATSIVALEPELPDEAIDMMDQALDGADDLIKIAIMDTYFEMTGSHYHRDDLEEILEQAAREGDAGEEVYMAARLALGRINRRIGDAIGDWAESDLVITATRARRRRGVRRRRGRPAAAAEVIPRTSMTIIIHGTWAADGKWWRPGGDFFDYVKDDLDRSDLYGAHDQFKWSGKNRNSKRREGGKSLVEWMNGHPADVVNVFAHSHGANVAMLSTRGGVKIDRLVMLSPPVRKDYFARWSNVKEAWNIQAKSDPVVAIARGGKWFERDDVVDIKLAASGHSASHDPEVWHDENLPDFIGMPWP